MYLYFSNYLVNVNISVDPHARVHGSSKTAGVGLNVDLSEKGSDPSSDNCSGSRIHFSSSCNKQAV